MDRGLGLAQALKHGLRPRARRRGERRLVDERKNLGETPVRVVMGGPGSRVTVLVRMLARAARVLVDPEFRRRHIGAKHTIRVHVRVAGGERAQRLLQVGQWQAGIEQGSKRHVAGNAGEAIKIQDPTHSRRDSLKL